ncbi:uncharacterized protein LOC123513172 isoform X2 [Portunus trituberculatus]|uniref:uncharacterized protein LOC123513172 isoform X2 n=1 Tax=Portunus trituberculatus TaxID=210409 RepID=UPI001E1CF2EC|nr:uncharacterized protein LOC123513172 isoform X2 [Portunus trituberculatus]
MSEEAMVETWVTVNGGSVGAVCSPLPTVSRHSAHLHSLARSVASAVLNVVPALGAHPVTASESDEHGHCATKYQLMQASPVGREVLRTKNLATCTPRDAGLKPLSVLTDNVTLSCHHVYEGSVGDETLHHVRCQQTLTLSSVAAMDSSLTLSLLQFHPFRPTSLNHGPLHEVNLGMEMMSSLTKQDQITKAYSLLSQMCEELSQRVTSKAALLYPDLVDVLQHLDQETLMRQYQEVNSGRLCPNHQKLRGVFSGALRDSSASTAAAAKCSLILSGLVRSSSSWALSLVNVKQPSTETLHVCGGLLATDHWEASEVLGIATMARHASCKNGDDNCLVMEAARRIAHRLSGKLNSCSEVDHHHQVLIAIRGLANMRHYGREVELKLQTCGGNERAADSTRVAAIAALGRGPCSSQVLNWLKWKVLNETLSSELRITAFQSLWQCSEKEAKAAAILITQRNSDPQVKSYANDFLSDSKTNEDTRQFSRHLLANLTALLGLQDTYLFTDVVFQDSFLPRSIALNLSSPLLKHVGGSIQFGSRLENLENVLQAVFGPNGLARGSVEMWLSTLIEKIEQMFATASQDFIQSHERSKRSYALSDVVQLLNRVQHSAVTELQGWISAGLGEQECVFLPYAFDPMALHWEELITSWFDDLLETTYSSLINSNAELTTAWAEVDEQVVVWSVLGTPVEVWQREGGLISLAASSKVNLLSLLTNPYTSTLNIGLGPSMGVYSRLGMSINSLPGRIVVTSTTQAAASIDVSAVLALQGSDHIDLRIDLPDSSFHGYSVQATHSLETPDDNERNHEEEASDIHESQDTSNGAQDDDRSSCDEDDDILSGIGEKVWDNEIGGKLVTKRYCSRGLETALGIKSGQVKQWVVGQQEAAFRSLGYLHKREGITGYKILISWKNPGRKSFFLDMSIEAEGLYQDYRAGIVVGLTYSPHITFKVQCHSKEYSASTEVSLVNDPNLKRIDGHVRYQRIHYGLKAELLMVQDGGHMSVKPRLVVSYPGVQEDALLEGYFARYFSDKVTSVTVDVYTEGSLKAYLDAALKGTAEVKITPDGSKVVMLKNINFSSQNLSFGVEATLSRKSKGVEGRVQVMWGGKMAVVDGRVTILGDTGDGEGKAYEMSLQVLLPSYPHLTTSILCITYTQDSQIMNNVTLTMGGEAVRREFQVFHSTSWKVTREQTNLKEHLPQMVPQHHGLAVEVINELCITSPDVNIEWKVNHGMKMTQRSVENVITADVNRELHKIKANFYDQTRDTFKYHVELEVSLADWYFSYIDTLEQQTEGEVLGVSTTVMPSGRIYATTSRYFINTKNSITQFEIYFDIMVKDGSVSWNIIGQEAFKCTPSGITLVANVKAGQVEVFGLEASLEGITTSQVDFHAKTWARNVFEGEVSFGIEDGKTNFSLNLLVIPLDQEIISRVAVDHQQNSGGKLDGELSWDARGDPSSALTLSSALQLPQVGSPLQISGSLSLLHWMWKTNLMVEFGNEVGDIHKVSFIFILPDKSRFETGSQMDLSFSQKNFSVMTDFYLHLPAGDRHNLSVAAKGILSDELSEARLNLHADSPVSQEMVFLAHVIKKESEDASNLNFKLQTSSEAKYWEMFSSEVKGEWNGKQIDGAVEVDWGDVAVILNMSGLYEIIDNKHHLAASSELRVPSLAAWHQLKSSIEGTLSNEQNPSSFKVIQTVMVEKDYKEVFSSQGHLTVHPPEMTGELSISHDGKFASRQLYNMEGKFTGQEVEMRVVGTVDGEPVRATVHYIHSKEVKIHASYRSEDYFSLSVTTQLQDFLIGTIGERGPAYSLSTEGQLVVLGQRTKMSHQLSFSDTRASSFFKLDPLQGKPFMLKKIRIKLGHNHWRTDVILNWGQRIFTYHDEVNIPSLRGLSFKVEVNAPALRLNSIVMSLETIEEAQGGQTVYLHLQRHNSTLHSARVMFYKYDTDGESVWQAGATDVVLNKQTYQDVMFRHVVIPLTSGLEVKSNMTVGHTPLVIVAVRVTPDARALGLALCTTGEECVRVQAQARAQSTLSTRTLSVSVHALNSLFWKDEQEPLIQNSVTFLAEETAEKMLVSGGVQRLECVEVGCTTSTTKGLLHTTLLLTPNTLDVMVNTTHRTIALTSVLQESQPNEVPESSLPGGILAHSYILENQLWLDKQHDPSGGIRCTISLASYESSRASEYVLASSLHHSSFTRDLDVQSSLILRAESTVTIVAVLDVFSLREDSLKMEVNLQQESARYILHGTLSKANYVSGRLVDATVVVVPSPDSCEFSIAVVILPQTPPHLPTIMPATLEFKLFCELDAVDGHTTVSCKVITPSVNEKISVGYQKWETIGCVGGLGFLDLLNHNYQLQYNSCHDPASVQTTLSRNGEMETKDELSLKFGMVDVHRAEVDLLSATGLSVQLHPPFLLYVTAHHSRSLQSWWQHIMIGAHDELYNLTVIARGLVQDLTTDLQNTESLVAISSSSSASSLVQHLCSEGYQLLQEVQNDQLLLDIIHSIQASIDVTSTIVETGFAYISRNYGETFQEVVTGIKVWLEAATMNIGSYFVQLVEDVQHYFITTLTFISSSPHMLLDQVLSVPLIEQAAEWTLGQIHLIQESVVYSFTRDLISIITSSLHKVLSFLYSEEEETHNKVDSEVWHFWVPLGKCSHSLLDVWQYISGTFKRTSHQEYLGSVLLRWWHLFTHPQQLFHHLSPPFPGEGAIIGNNNFITIDGRIFTLTPSCLHVLLTDAKHQSFTLLSHQQDVETGTNYTLLLQNTTVNIHSNMMVTIDNAAVSLPYISDTLNVVRQLHKLEITARHTSGEDLITFTCWLGQQACVVGVSGWLHADTKGLLGNFNLNPADDFMRPGGKVALSQDVFSQSWRLASDCVPEREIPVLAPQPETQLLCHKFLLHYTAPVFACHKAVNIMPFYDTCLKFLTTSHDDRHEAQEEDHENSNTLHTGELGTAHSLLPSSVPTFTSQRDEGNQGTTRSLLSNSTEYEVKRRDVPLLLTEGNYIFSGISERKISVLCDVAAAYSTICGWHKIDFTLPSLCEKGKQLTYEEPLSPEPQLDLVMLINEESCDSFIYQNLVRPFPQVLTRVAQGKNISDVQIGLLGFGSGTGEVVYRTKGTSLLTPASQLRIIRPPEGQRSQASLLTGMRAISKFPFRAGSMRVALVMRCNSRDIPKFTDTLPKEMQRRRLVLFTLTPDLLMFNPRRPKAVRNTIGIDRWRVYNLHLDRQQSTDSWGIRAPGSNIAQLAMKSGGGVFSLSALRSDDRTRYHMKLFRRVLSRAMVRVAVNAYRQRPQP